MPGNPLVDIGPQVQSPHRMKNQVRNVLTALTVTKHSLPAIEESWTDKFIGKAPQALREHIQDCCKKAAADEGPSYYGKFIPIIQSSGMGKSRLADEFSMSSFLIPINLRPVTNGWYIPCTYICN